MSKKSGNAKPNKEAAVSAVSSPSPASSPSTSANANANAVRVHRCRFVDWQPKTITALSFNASGSTLAVARDSGDIEIWNVRHGWFCEKRIPGTGQATVQALIWVPGPHGSERLISAGLNSRIIEWDLLKLVPKFVSDSYGGAVWSAALKDSKKSAEECVLVAGCEDGSLRLFDVSDAKQGPVYLKSLFKHDARVLSVCWSHGLLVSGGADASIRIWNPENGRCTSHISVGTVANESALVWSVKVLSDKTIVHGDSGGRVQFWDPEFGTQIAQFAVHKADVLSVVVAPNQQAVYASGVDNTVAEYRLADDKWIHTAFQRPHTHDVLALAIGPQFKSVAPHMKGQKVAAQQVVDDAYLVSGGVDTQLCVYHTSSRLFRSRPRKLSPFPAAPPVSLSAPSAFAPRPRFLLHQGHQLDLWQLGDSKTDASQDHLQTQPDGTVLPLQNHHTHLLSISTKKSSAASLSLCCSALSPDSHWIACSDPVSLRLFKLNSSASVNPDVIPVERVEVKALKASHAVIFSQDSSKLICATFDSTIQVFDLNKQKVVATFSSHRGGQSVPSMDEDDEDDEEEKELARVRAKAAATNSDDEEDEEEKEAEAASSSKEKEKAQAQAAKAEQRLLKRAAQSAPGLIRTLAVSRDGNWLCSADEYNRIFVFNLKSLKFHCALPIFDSPHLALAFHPRSPTLVVSCASNQFYLFDVAEKKLSDWSREHGAHLPKHFLKQKDKVVHIAFNPARPDAFLLQSHSYLCHVDLTKPLVSEGQSAGSGSSLSENGQAQGQGRKRSRQDYVKHPQKKSAKRSLLASPQANESKDNEDGNFRLITNFRPLMFADFVDHSSMVVIELPWLKIMQSFPDAMYRHRYGT